LVRWVLGKAGQHVVHVVAPWAGLVLNIRRQNGQSALRGGVVGLLGFPGVELLFVDGGLHPFLVDQLAVDVMGPQVMGLVVQCQPEFFARKLYLVGLL